MPNTSQLDLDKTFENQRNLVNNTIVLIVMQTLDRVTFPVKETVIYEIIHNCHKHKREENLKKNRSAEYQDEQNRRKHLNSRRNDVSDVPVYLFIFIILTFITFYNYRNERIVLKQ